MFPPETPPDAGAGLIASAAALLIGAVLASRQKALACPVARFA